MAELTGYRTQLTFWIPKSGPPFWLAECTACRDDWVIEVDDALTKPMAQRAGEVWCQEHQCRRPEPTTIAEQRAEDARNDAMFGQFEDGAA